MSTLRCQGLILVAFLAGGAGCRHPRPAVGAAEYAQGSAPAEAEGRGAVPDAADGPLLLLDDEAPLLLTDDLPEMTGPMADNSRCHVCHVNYEQEELALVHARADLGCVACHGESDEHIADESWASGGNGTAPDTMYPLDRINASCFECHPRDTIDAELHEAFLAGQSDEQVCTDCHGDHRLPVRRCRWK